jgi:hypothetical protein
MKKQTNFQKDILNIDKEFKDKILKSYHDIRERYIKAIYDSSWDSSGLSAGKFCEIILRFLQKTLTGTYTPLGQQISNFPDECRKLVTLPNSCGNESLRIIIPRALSFLYTIRGKRGIGHVGGDIDNNEIDATIIFHTATWIFCEIIRIYHSLSIEEAGEYISMMLEKKIPDVWFIEDKKRVLRKDLNYKQKTLLLLYTDSSTGVLLEDMFSWVEHSNLSNYKRDVINKLHKEKLIEYNKDDEIIYLSPLGVKEVEENILSK